MCCKGMAGNVRASLYFELQQEISIKILRNFKGNINTFFSSSISCSCLSVRLVSCLTEMIILYISLQCIYFEEFCTSPVTLIYTTPSMYTVLYILWKDKAGGSISRFLHKEDNEGKGGLRWGKQKHMWLFNSHGLTVLFRPILKSKPSWFQFDPTDLCHEVQHQQRIKSCASQLKIIYIKYRSTKLHSRQPLDGHWLLLHHSPLPDATQNVLYHKPEWYKLHTK